MKIPEPKSVASQALAGSDDSDAAFEADIARKTFEWLEEQFADRDQKDVETLEVASKTFVG